MIFLFVVQNNESNDPQEDDHDDHNMGTIEYLEDDENSNLSNGNTDYYIEEDDEVIDETMVEPALPNEAEFLMDSEPNDDSFSRENFMRLLQENREYEKLLKAKDEEIDELRKTIEKQHKILEIFQWDLNSFKENDRKVAHLTGLPNFATLSILVDFVKPGILVFSDILSKEQVVIMVLMYIRLGLCFSTLAVLFRVCPATVTRYFYSGLYSLFKQLKGLVKWPSQEIIASNTPTRFRKLYDAPIAVILDCFELFTEKPGVKEAVIKLYSNYKHHYTVKELVGITSFGTISFISKPYTGRTSDKFITEQCGLLDKLNNNDLVLADRGFTVRQAVEDRGAVLKVPDSSSKKKQLSSTAVERTRALASIRNEVERSIGSLRQKSGILSTRLPITLLNHEHNGENVLNMLVTVACALFNLCPSIISP